MLKRDDFLLAFTSGLLALSGEQAAAALDALARSYELHEPRKPDQVSLGVREPEGREAGYAGWLRALRAEHPRAVRLFWRDAPVDPSLPPHLAAAFEGAPAPLLQVETATGARTYGLGLLRSPSHALGPARFIAWVEAQEHPEPLWERMRELVSQSNELNQRAPVAPGQLAAYLLTEEGTQVYELLASELCGELQIECFVREWPLRIPESLEDALMRYTDTDEPSGREPVFLYPETQSLSPGEVHALIAAQSFSPEEIWARADARLREFTEPTALPATARQWPAFLEGLSPEAVQSVASAVCQAVCGLCEEQGREPVIPEPLKASFGPDALGQKRARARSRLSSSRWFLQSPAHPWEFVCFERLPGVPLPGAGEDASRAKARFQQALQDIEAFAVRQESPFAEAFRLARCLLGADLPLGDFGPEHGQRLAEALEARGFSEQARDNFQGLFALAEDLSVLRWPVAKMFGLLAVAVSDVFGGMGSWNDMPVEDDGEYQRLSAELFQAMKAHFAALLSWST